MTAAGGSAASSSSSVTSSGGGSVGSRSGSGGGGGGGGESGGASTTSVSSFFRRLDEMRTLGITCTMSVLVALAAFALPAAPTRRAGLLGAASICCMVVALVAVHRIGRAMRRHEPNALDPIATRTRRAFQIAVLALFAAVTPSTYLLDVAGPVDGILALALLLYAMDASRRSAITAAVVLSAPHVLLIALVASGFITHRGSLETVPSADGDWGNLGSAALVFGLAFAVARVYRARTTSQLADLAEAGREVAARDVLLREARAELDRAIAIGERGRFTEQTLGSFVLGPILGFGGMGEIYEATHRATHIRAAVKVLRAPAHGELTDAFQRFEREAAIVGKLDSPNIVKLLEVGGLEAAFPYMAMEYLEGAPLDRLLQTTGRLPPAEVSDLVSQVARGLSAASSRDVVHRDLKPSNVLRGSDGTWKILDFGLGRIAGESASLTGNGLVGTLGYLAPEQLAGEGRVSHQTDIHALGVLAYRSLTGNHAFVERDPAQVMREVETRLPRRPSEVANVPRAVDDVLRIALAKDPRDRFDDALAFAKAFADALGGIVDPALADRACRLGRALDWSSPIAKPAARRPVRGTAGRRREPTVTVSVAPPAPPAPPTTPPAVEPGDRRSFTAPTVTRAPGEDEASFPIAPSSAPASTTAKLSLVAVPDDLLQSLWLAPARSVLVAFTASALYSISQVPLSPHPDKRWIGYAAVTLLFGTLLVVSRLARDQSERGVRRFAIGTIAAFGVATSYLYFFGPTGDVTSYVTLGLMLFISGSSTSLAVAATLVVAVPHFAMLVAYALGRGQDIGFLEVRATSYGRWLNITQVAALYALAFTVGTLFKNHLRRTLTEISAAFRASAERDARLRDARLALERAVGIGLPGRFSGKRLGRFFLGNTLGRGGMGEVYEATEAETNREAAVKVLTRRFGDEGSPIARFDAEAKAIASLASPHVVGVLEVGTDVVPYIAMERLHGLDLAALLQRSLFLPPKDVAEMLSQIALGLEAAHAKGIIHADITPRNLFRTTEGTWKLLDFGVALTGEERGGRPAGTPGYLAPEQLAHGAEVDHRVDIHALGACAYRALTGRPAFAGRDAATTLYRILHEMPLRPSHVAEVSKLVDDVLRIALAKAPEERFDEAATFAKAFANAAADVADERIAKRAERLNQKAPWASKRRAFVV